MHHPAAQPQIHIFTHKIDSAEEHLGLKKQKLSPLSRRLNLVLMSLKAFCQQVTQPRFK